MGAPTAARSDETRAAWWARTRVERRESLTAALWDWRWVDPTGSLRADPMAALWGVPQAEHSDVMRAAHLVYHLAVLMVDLLAWTWAARKAPQSARCWAEP